MLSGDGFLGGHRKVHLPAGEVTAYSAGNSFDAFDTPVGRIGMLIDYDKTFPESARSLALDGAQIIACLSAWPASITDRAAKVTQDRQARLFDLYDCAGRIASRTGCARLSAVPIHAGERPGRHWRPGPPGRQRPNATSTCTGTLSATAPSARRRGADGEDPRPGAGSGQLCHYY